MNEVKDPQPMKLFENVIRTYQGLIYSIAFGITTDAQDSWDLTQETFLKAYQCKEFLSEGFNQKAWLATVVRNDALKKLRSLKNRLRYLFRYCGFEEATEASELESALLKSEQVSFLKNLLEGLSEEERQIITLRFTAGLTYQEIADIMNIKIGTVMSRLSRLKENFIDGGSYFGFPVWLQSC